MFRSRNDRPGVKRSPHPFKLLLLLLCYTVTLEIAKISNIKMKNTNPMRAKAEQRSRLQGLLLSSIILLFCILVSEDDSHSKVPQESVYLREGIDSIKPIDQNLSYFLPLQ